MRPLKVWPPTTVVEMSWVLVARRRMSEVCRPFWSAFRSAAAAVGLAIGPKPVGGQVIEAVAETSERPHFMLFWLWSFRTLDVRMLTSFVDLDRTYLQLPLQQWGFWQCLTFSWTTLGGKHYRHPIAIMGNVDTFRQVSLVVGPKPVSG